MNRDRLDRAAANGLVDPGSPRFIGRLGDEFRDAIGTHAKDLRHEMNALAVTLTGIGVDMYVHTSPRLDCYSHQLELNCVH